MTTQISGDTGVSAVQAGIVAQSDLAAGVAGNGPAFRATAAVLSWDGTEIKLPMSVEEFDTNSNYDNALYRFTPTVAGYYQVSFRMQIAESGPFPYVKKNGVIAIYGEHGGYVSSVGSGLLYLNGSTDYLELFGMGPATSNLLAGTAISFWSAALVRAA